MGIYSIPNTFIAGTKASAEEVNTNFEYIANILNNIGTARYAFCINDANRSSYTNKEDFLHIVNGELSTKIGGAYANAIFTDGYGISKTITESSKLKVESTKYAELIPDMSSDSSNGVTCLATSEESSKESWHAFDSDINTYWGSFVGVTAASLAVSLPKKHIVRKYSIKVLYPTKWTLEGSNDQTHWTELDSYSVAQASTVTRDVSAFGNFQTYRLNAEALMDYQVRVADLQFYEKNPEGSFTFPETKKVYFSEYGLETYNNKCFKQPTIPAGMDLYEAAIPEMITNVVPTGYKMTASGYSASSAPYLAADQKLDTYWEAPKNINGNWIQIEFPNYVNAKVLKLTVPSSGAAMEGVLQNGVLLGSSNGSTWTELYSFENILWHHAGESRYFYFDRNNSKYKYYRIEGKDSFCSLAEFQLFVQDSDGGYYLGEAESDDIWFCTSEPYKCYQRTQFFDWTSCSSIPVGEIDLDASGNISAVRTYPYNQNGFGINSLTTAENSGNIVTYDSFISHLGEIGHTALPNKVILQWGKAYASSTVLYPIAFPNAVFCVVPVAADYNDKPVGVNSQNSSSFVIRGTSGVQYYWFAIGW